MTTEQVTMAFWQAWQAGDAKTLRSLLYDQGRFGVANLSADDLVSQILSIPCWNNLKLVKSVYSGGDGAIFYEGNDPRTGQGMRASEFYEVANDKITSMHGTIVSGVSMRHVPTGLSFIAADAI